MSDGLERDRIPDNFLDTIDALERRVGELERLVVTLAAGDSRWGAWVRSVADGVTSLASGSDNVGVGTDAPAGKHHVKGDDDVVQQTVQGYSSQTDNIAEWLNYLSTVLVRISDDGKVVIGESSYTNPSSMLEIFGNTHLFGFFETDGTENKRRYTYTAVNDVLYMAARQDNNVLLRVLMSWKHDGRIGIGTSSPTGQLHIDQPSTSAAIPVLLLDQADLSEEFVDFRATVGSGNPIDTAALGTYYGKIRVAVNGSFKYIGLYNS